jgi:hypothetical protein
MIIRKASNIVEYWYGGLREAFWGHGTAGTAARCSRITAAT